MFIGIHRLGRMTKHGLSIWKICDQYKIVLRTDLNLGSATYSSSNDSTSWITLILSETNMFNNLPEHWISFANLNSTANNLSMCQTLRKHSKKAKTYNTYEEKTWHSFRCPLIEFGTTVICGGKSIHSTRLPTGYLWVIILYTFFLAIHLDSL